MSYSSLPRTFFLSLADLMFSNSVCHFHYSTRFATKCVGCGVAILKQFVEINRNQQDECWHPECYMIQKVSSFLSIFDFIARES